MHCTTNALTCINALYDMRISVNTLKQMQVDGASQQPMDEASGLTAEPLLSDQSDSRKAIHAVNPANDPIYP